MDNSNVAGFVAVGLALGLAASAPAKAGETPSSTYIGLAEQDVAVMDRARPNYDAAGIPLGGVSLFPSLDVSGVFDDNVFKRPDAQSDYYFQVSPALRLKSGWGRHFLELYSGLNNYNYTKYSAENLTDWNIGTDGRLDISRAANITATVWYGHLHEPWSAPNNISGYQAAPNRYFQTHSDIAAIYQPSRLGVRIGASYDRYNWTNTPTIGGGYLINNDRDEDEYQAYAKVFYEFSPGYSGFVRTSYDYRQFDLRLDRSGFDRSSHGYRVDGGLDLQISHLVKGEVFLGYLNQNYPKNVPTPLPNLSGIDYGAQLDWYLSPILTLHLTGSRQMAEVVITGVSAADNNTVVVSADYEFRPNIIVQGRVSYTNSRYIGTNRTDDYPGASIGIKYLINRYMSANLNYNYSARSTNSVGAEYTDNAVSVGLSFHL